MQATLVQQRGALGASQQHAAHQRRSATRSSASPTSSGSGGGGSLLGAACHHRGGVGSSGSSATFSPRSNNSSSKAARRLLPPARARRPRDPILAPMIELEGPGGAEAVDLYGFLLRNRIIFLSQRISDTVAIQVVASLLALDSISPEEEIKMYINCPQGSPYAVTSILDTMRAIRAPVATVAFGIVGGTATAVLASGAKGRRYSMENTRILLQQPMGGLQGSADECNITATELNRNMRVMYRFLSEATGLSEEQVEMECDRDNFLSPKQAMELGVIDGVIA